MTTQTRSGDTWYGSNRSSLLVVVFCNKDWVARQFLTWPNNQEIFLTIFALTEPDVSFHMGRCFRIKIYHQIFKKFLLIFHAVFLSGTPASTSLWRDAYKSFTLFRGVRCHSLWLNRNNFSNLHGFFWQTLFFSSVFTCSITFKSFWPEQWGNTFIIRTLLCCIWSVAWSFVMLKNITIV